MKSSKEIRDIWVKFFESKGHKLEPSAPLVPQNDPTLLWINAGVAALKKYFDGREKPINPRIVNCQKCIRTNDIENVGNTARHHTFFEMLGNFSIGDYFKFEVIPWAFELLTDPKWFGIDKDLLYITYYPDDVEALNLWVKQGMDPSHMIPLEENFWEIGEGPSGPDTEIFYDRGEKYDKRGKELIEQDIENDRFIEIWNIVFSQFNAKPGVPRSEYKELPSKNIDTGSGLERLCCVLQGVETNYDTDLFMPIIHKIEEVSGVAYHGQKEFKVIADHIRTVTFAISDGAIFSNEGRGYVLRRVLRRASKYAKKLGITKPFLYTLVDTVIEIMGGFYSDLESKKEIVKKVIRTEEEKFLETLSQGEKKIEEMFQNMDGSVLSGKQAFLLFDTYGFPIELTEEYATEHGCTVNMEEFHKEMEAQRERSRAARGDLESFKSQNKAFLDFKEESKFVGYTQYEIETEVLHVFPEGIVLKETPFYATSGGQVADRGTINEYSVIDVMKLPNGQFLHILDTNTHNLKKGDTVIASIDVEERLKTQCNHSATHLLHKALKDVLGDHVRQQGSQVDGSLLRFDFNNYNTLTDEELLKVEKIVNQYISENHPVQILNLKKDEAMKLGAEAQFTEKYGEVVRVVDMEVSKEFCGGTHVKNTGDIVKFSIVSFESVGSGIYRITGATGNKIGEMLLESTKNIEENIQGLIQKQDRILQLAKEKNLSVVAPSIEEVSKESSYLYVLKMREQLNQYKEATKECEKNYQAALGRKALEDLSQYDSFIEGNTLITKVENMEVSILKQLVDALLNKMNTGLVMIASVFPEENKVTFVCKNNIGVHAGNLVKSAAVVCGGNGGGKPDMAQAGGKDISKVDLALSTVKESLHQ